MPTFKTVKEALDKRFKDYEIIIFDDGSTDNTAKIADDIVKTDPKVTVIHHKQPMNLGYIYKSGIKMARMEYTMLVTGDNDVDSKYLADTFDLRFNADMVIPYHLNEKDRPFLRRIISKWFVCFMNILFGLNLKYYNGLVLHKTNILKSIDINTNSFAYQAEALVKLLKKGYTYIEIGIVLSDRKKGASKAFRPKNVLGILIAVIKLYWNIHV